MNFNPMLKNHEVVSMTKPSMRYDGKGDFSLWQKEAKAKLAELLGMDKFEKCDPHFTIEHEKETNEYKEYRFVIESEPGYNVPCVLRVPTGVKGKLPLIVCLQGHSKGFHISLGVPKYEGDEETINGGDRDFVVRAIKEGYCALAIEQRNFGECTGKPDNPTPNCLVSSLIATLVGRTTIGERVWDTSRAIDAVLEHFDFVDEDRILCMGNSGGGTSTCYIACMDERIALAMPSCAVCTYKDSIGAMYHCACNYVPNIAQYFDMADLGGIIAPRKMIVVNGVEDPIFPKHGVNETVEIMKELYNYAGAPENVAHVEGPGGHRFYADLAWPVLHKMMGDN